MYIVVVKASLRTRLMYIVVVKASLRKRLMYIVVVKASLRTRLMYVVVVKARVVMSIFPCRFQSSQQAPTTCIERRD